MDARKIEWRGFYEEFQTRSDRASAIVGATFLDGHLGDLIASFLIPDEAAVEGLLGIEHPLGSFGARLRAALCLGLISTDEHHDLHLILTISDLFARQMRGVSFEDPEVRQQCESLRLPRRVLLAEEEPTPRARFVFATALLAQTLSLRALECEARRCQPPQEYEFVSGTKST